ncbi:MAG: ComF family protein [Patescibacteria group bacterium]
MFETFGNLLLDLLFPKFCVSCDKMGSFLCKKCFLKVKPYKQKTCLPNRQVKLDLEKSYLDMVYAAAFYEKPISTLIHELKYKSVKDIGITCARMMKYLLNIPKADLISYVPLHKKRLRERGFNQAEVIAQELSKLTNIPYQKLLIRTKHNKPQSNISSREKRLSRMQDAFSPLHSVERDSSPRLARTRRVRPKSVILIDDVCTTGTTLNECAKILKVNGVKKVIGLVVAHGD